MLVVDAQLHLWGADRPDRPWPRDRGVREKPHRAVPPTATSLLAEMDRAGVGAAVLVPPSWEGDRNDLVLAAAREWPGRFAVMGRFPLHEPAGAARLAGWRDIPGMLGVRVTLHRSPWREWFADRRLDWFWSAAEEAGTPVAVYAPDVPESVARLADRHPALRLVLDHLCLPVEIRDPGALEVVARMAALARFPNVAVKATAVPCHSSVGPPFRVWHEPLVRLVREFGSHRVFWGSDLTRLPCSYRACVELFTRELPLSPPEREDVLGRGICTWLGWRPGS